VVAASLRANTESFYDILRVLRARHPLLVLENCFNGAGYLDYALQGLTDAAWLTDDVGAADVPAWALQRAFAGASRAMPARYLEMWLATPPGRDRAALDYRALSTMGGAWGLSVRLTALSAQQRGWLQQLVRRYKQLRPYLIGGDLDHLSDPAEQAWFATAYVMPGGRQAAILAIRNDATGAAPEERSFLLRGLVPDAHYQVTWDLGDAGDVGDAVAVGRPATPPSAPTPAPAAAPTAAPTGADLMANGLSIALPGQTGAIVYLTALDSPAAARGSA
jgi:alpha-galactosidase